MRNKTQNNTLYEAVMEELTKMVKQHLNEFNEVQTTDSIKGLYNPAFNRQFVQVANDPKNVAYNQKNGNIYFRFNIVDKKTEQKHNCFMVANCAGYCLENFYLIMWIFNDYDDNYTLVLPDRIKKAVDKLMDWFNIDTKDELFGRMREVRSKLVQAIKNSSDDKTLTQEIYKLFNGFGSPAAIESRQVRIEDSNAEMTADAAKKYVTVTLVNALVNYLKQINKVNPDLAKKLVKAIKFAEGNVEIKDEFFSTLVGSLK